MEDTKYNKQNYNAIDLTKFICSILVVAIHIKPFGDNVDFHFLNYGIQNYLARIAVPFQYGKASEICFEIVSFVCYLVTDLFAVKY